MPPRKKSAALPARVFLPSGKSARIDDRAARRAAEAGVGDDEAGVFRREMGILGAEGVLRGPDDRAIDPRALTLRDVHALRAFLFHAGVLEEEPGEYLCSNCEAPFSASPSRLLEIGPFRDGELSDPELDAPFSFDTDHPIPAIELPETTRPTRPRRARRARTLRLTQRTAAQALPLWRAAERPALSITPAVVAAMGVAALGEERRARVIADALAAAPDEAWSSVVDWFCLAHYSDRLLAVHRCAECKARTDIEVPLVRELVPPLLEGGHAVAAGRGSRRRRGEFPDLDAFEAKVRETAAHVYRERGVRNVDLFIDAGVPACDDGGEPLLGCYTPGGTDGDLGVQQPPEVRIFYRTFEGEFRDNPEFDVEAEIEETIDHELTHHLHHLSGTDPLDDDERSEIEREQMRRVGQREGVRRAARGFAQELVHFLRSTWPVWLIACGATALAWCA